MGHSGLKIVAHGHVELTGELGGIISIRLVQIPERICNCTGSQGIFQRSFLVGASADYDKIGRWICAQMIRGGGEVQKTGDEGLLGVRAGAQSTGAVGGGGDEGFAGDDFGCVFARRVAQVKLCAAGLRAGDA